ncbi:COG4315 family predicted lipoprotein [Haloarchaeobius sp. TZWWS8]|uniref:COG4315 family predicted lipoprotein n=1 Tax=Haloarchaeobius sp. TZWWS8 TaxID=3446121 RepID=UPI003EBD24D7
MAPTRRSVLAGASSTLALGTLAGCLGDDSEPTDTGTDTDTGTGGTDTTTAGTTETETTTESGESITVDVREHPDLGEILVDGEGMTLYMFDNDTKGSGESTCTGGCLDAWPPLTVDGAATGGDGVSAPLSTFNRGDDTLQVAADGWPLYYFASDSGPGDVKGQGVNDVWWVLRPDGTPVKDTGTGTSTTTNDGSSGGNSSDETTTTDSYY